MSSMKLISSNFSDGAPLPPQFAFCKKGDPVALSDNMNPHLGWSSVPEGTKSFALALIDIDVPSSADDVNQVGKVVSASLPRVSFTHLLLADIPAGTTEIAQGALSSSVTPRGKNGPALEGTSMVQGINNYTNWFAGDADMDGQYYGYDGPCPPWNDELIHRYFYTLYALDVDKLDLPEAFTFDQLQDAMKGHILAKAHLQFHYTLNEDVTEANVLINSQDLEKFS